MRALTILFLLCAGILAGAQLGKIAPLVGWYQQESGLTLVIVGWLVALIGFFVALAASPAGIGIQRFGARRASVLAFVVLSAGAFWLAAAGSPIPVLAGRLIEALGYLVLVIAVPALLSDLSPTGWRGPVMAVWGGFVPVGFAIANLLASAIIPAYGERAFLVAVASLFAFFALPASVLIWRVKDVDAAPRFADAEGEESKAGARLTPAIWLLGLAFGAYVVSSMGFFTFMPTFVSRTGDRMLVSAGVIALLVPVGNALAGMLLHGRGGRFASGLAASAFLTTVVAATPAFWVTNPAFATVFAAAVAVSGGVVASSLFAAIPSYVPRGGSVSVAIGLVAQAGGIGTLVGPPLTAAIIANRSWAEFGGFLSIAALTGLACLLPLLRARR
jgi:MFS family permease